jgi:hypothetical protein
MKDCLDTWTYLTAVLDNSVLKDFLLLKALAIHDSVKLLMFCPSWGANMGPLSSILLSLPLSCNGSPSIDNFSLILTLVSSKISYLECCGTI